MYVHAYTHIRQRNKRMNGTLESWLLRVFSTAFATVDKMGRGPRREGGGGG